MKKLTENDKKFFTFTDSVYETWDKECGIEGAVRMPVFGIRVKGTRYYEKVVGETIVDEWFYDKYKGIILHTDHYGYIYISRDRRNLQRFFNVRINKCLKGYLRLHHFIRGHSNGGGLFVDHINSIRNDNRFSNLRTATVFENARNTKKSITPKLSKYKGVFYDKDRDGLTKTGRQKKCWRALIFKQYKWIARWYNTEIDAAKGYNDLVKEHFGEFAKLNEIP
jgi:hypothetical protein